MSACPQCKHGHWGRDGWIKCSREPHGPDESEMQRQVRLHLIENRGNSDGCPGFELFSNKSK